MSECYAWVYEQSDAFTMFTLLGMLRQPYVCSTPLHLDISDAVNVLACVDWPSTLTDEERYYGACGAFSYVFNNCLYGYDT